MINRTKKLWISAVFLAILCALCAALFFQSPTAEAASVDDNYYFKCVSVDITVNRNKTFYITETLKTHFIEDGINTGIIRDIQRESTTTRIIDGKTFKGKRYFSKLDDVEVTLDGGEAKVTRSLYGAFHSIKMQTPEGYISAGDHTFKLSYTYDMGDDRLRGFDDFTLDVFGYAMAYTQAFEAKITFPEGTDLSRVSFRTNEKQAWEPDTDNWEYARVQGNVISLFALPQAENKGYTVQVILPKGYFETTLTFYWYYLLFVGLALLGIGACVAIIIAGTLNKKVLSPVEYLPPEDIDIMHFSAVWNKGARYRDIGALVLKWAAKGYITIKKDGEKHLILIPDKSLNDKNQLQEVLLSMPFRERRFFEALMVDAGLPQSFSTKRFKKRISSSKRIVYECSEKLVEHGNDPKPYIISREALATALPFVSLIPTLAIMLYYCVLANGWVFLFFLIFMAAGTFVGTAFNRTRVILMLIFPLSFYGGLYTVFALFFAQSRYDYAGLLIIAPLWWALCLFVFPHIIKGGIRSKKVKEQYARICGFKNFLLLAELDRIQLMFDKTPDYFAEIAPYCYIMGISEKVQKRFAPLNFIPPAYMREGLTPDSIGRCTSHSCHHSSVSLSGGGGSGGSGGGGGGGGSSGGGGGGGGSRGC